MEIVARAPGYLRSEPWRLEIVDDARPGPTLAIRPGAAIEGRVVDTDGEAVSGTLRTQASAPGAPVEVQLPEACRLSILVPELEGTREVATATLNDDAGRPLRLLNWIGDPTARFQLAGGWTTLESLPPGNWTVRVEAADGARWEAQVSTAPGVPARVVLE